MDMEIMTREVTQVETKADFNEMQVCELNELQLALIGGGSGDVHVG
jgi:hypothetical protein